MERVSKTPTGVTFGRFRVLPRRRELLADGQSIKLGERAFDVLMALIQARGTVLGKNVLMTRVWPYRMVEHLPKNAADLYSSIVCADPSANRSFPVNRLSRHGCDCGQPLRGISL
jgi:hypothetical protein